MKDFLLYVRFALDYALKNRTLSHIKQYSRWYTDKKSGDSTLSRRLPWMTYDAVDFLSRICHPDMEVFEWGSGGSTLFFAARCKEVHTVEHDPDWRGFLTKKMEELHVMNVNIREIPGSRIDDFNERDYRNPDDFVSNDRKSAGLSFEEYVKAIDPFPEEHFDLVVVDGRVRNCCIKRAIPHVKRGGYLIVDNTDRSYYLAPFPELQDATKWEKTEFQGPVFFQHAFTRTSFFKRL